MMRRSARHPAASSTARADTVDAASKTTANKKQRGETIPECPDPMATDTLLPQSACTKVTLTWN
jgi:hypothetical protein